MLQSHKFVPVFTITEFVNIACYRLPPGYQYPGDTDDCWGLLYIDKGDLIVTTGEKQYLMKSGETAFLFPHQFRSYQVSTQGAVSIIVISFRCDSAYMKVFENKILFLNYMEKQCLSAIVKESEASFVYFDQTPPLIDMRRRDNAPFGSEQIICNNLEQLFIFIYRRNDTIHVENRAMPSKRLHHHEEIVLQVQDYLSKHFHKRITLQLLADKFSISISQLRHIYKNQTDHSIIADLSAIRITEAKRMIREHNLSFTQIAEATGYDNVYYFSNQFKKHTGMTPTEYSKSVRS